jgi:hypothetical protein
VPGAPAKQERSRKPAAAFYCVGDERYFEGAVGLVNSLRLLGHHEPISLLDCGLADAQRRLLAPHVTLIPAPGDAPPWLLKAVAPLDRPADVMVLLDADMVITRGLGPLIDRAAHGDVVVFENPVDRFVPEWGELLGLGPVRRRPYVGSGAIVVDRSLGTDVLRLMRDLQASIDFERTYWRANDPDYPFLYGDQDVLNAVLASRVEEDRVLALEARLAPTPPFPGLKLLDERVLRCGYADGTEPYLVHHHTVKPWLEPTHHGVYSRLLRRLLIGPGLAVRVPEGQLARRMRTGLLAYAERKRTNARERFRWHVRDPLRELIGPRVRARGARARSTDR